MIILGGSVREVFLNKLKNNKYISYKLYLTILNNYKEIIPNNFNIDEYNNKVLNKLYLENKEYFDNLYTDIDSNIHLDLEQIKAILSDEDYSLIIAGAGTGKTTTISSKVKYLVDKERINPERILVMSYTRKATEELEKRIREDFNIPAYITTFHSLGYEYLREIFYNRKCIILDRNKREEIFLKYFKQLYKDKNKIKEVKENFSVLIQKYNFLFSNFFVNNYEKYDTYDELCGEYVKYKMDEARYLGIDIVLSNWINKQLVKDDFIRTIKGDIVKSAGEAIIANYLFANGIDYYYEESYDELMDRYKVYKPDFTINYGGEIIYLEYFGLNDSAYNKIRIKKEKYHKEHNNKFIELILTPLNEITKVLKEKLDSINIYGKRKTKEEMYEHILKSNPFSQIFPLEDYLFEAIKYIKESPYRDNVVDRIKEYITTLNGEERKQATIQAKYILDFYKYYSKELYGVENYYFDFADLLYYANLYLDRLTTDTKLLFDYIIIDEYQDISNIKYELLYKTAKRNNAKIYAVGDDWQSIYSFSGSQIEYIYNFQEYFKGAKLFKISNTYRNSQELINYSGEFIMKNKNQIFKKLLSEKHIDRPIIKVNFEKDMEIECLKSVIKKIHTENPNHNILVLARTNRIIDKILDDESFIDSIDTKVIFKDNKDILLDVMTMHKSKGLTFDEVILFGLDETFPSVKKEVNWIESIFKNKVIKESIPFAEERRLFYVALTRTKNHVYLLSNNNYSKRSTFINEIDEIVKNYTK